MADFRVSTNEVKQRVDELRELNKAFKSAVDNLEGQEQTLVSMWEGSARDTFHNAFVSDIGQMGSFYNTIEAFASVLMTIVNNYIQTENMNIEIASERNY